MSIRKVKKIGFLGAPVVCKLFLDSLPKNGSEPWELIDINPSVSYDDSVRGLELMKLKAIEFIDFVRKSRSIDVLCLVFINNRSPINTKIAHFWNTKVVYYWIGTDVLNLHKGIYPRLQGKALQEPDLHLSAGHNLVTELKEMGVKSKLLIAAPDLPTECAAMPKEHGVLLSIPDFRMKFYGYDMLMRVVRAFPDTTFHIAGSEMPEYYNEPNIVFEGRLSREGMNALFDRVSIVMRYPEHDSTSLVLMESLIKGKRIISRFEFPYAKQAESFDELCKALESLLKIPPVPDWEGHAYAVEHFGRDRFYREFSSYFNSVLGEESEDGQCI